MKYYNRSNFEKEKMNIVAELQEMESDKVTDYMVLLKSVYTDGSLS